MSQLLEPAGFIVPDVKRFVRSWVQTNERNQDRLDSYLGNQTLQTYTPTLSSVSGTTAPNPGDDAEFDGWWFEFYGIVYAWARIIWDGANLDPGEGSNWFTVSLPVAVHASLLDLIPATSPNSTARSPNIGEGGLRDNSSVGTNTQTCSVQLNSETAVLLNTEHNNSQRAVRHDTPFTWAAGDRITILARYRRAL